MPIGLAAIGAPARAAGTLLLLSVLLTGAGAARAQSVEPDEAIAPNGQVMQKTALSAMQESVIYNAAMRQRLKAPAGPGAGTSAGIDATVGAAVPVAIELRDLPGEPDAADPWPAPSFLKYAMVEDKVVVIDPVAMRVVDVIGDTRTRP